MGWLPNYSYRKEITLSRASGAVTNYQMKLLLGESSGATGEDVDCGGHCLSSFNDIRFTTSDGTTLLDYWIESISGTTPNQLATIWIEFNSIGTSATTFYMYYGNSGVSAYSNGDSTFQLFDHFLGSSIDSEKWNNNTDVSDTLSVGSSIAQWSIADSGASRAVAGLDSKSTFDLPCAIESQWKVNFDGPTGGAGTTSSRFSRAIHPTSNVAEITDSKRIFCYSVWRDASTNDWLNGVGTDVSVTTDNDFIDNTDIRESLLLVSGSSKEYRNATLELSDTNTTTMTSGYFGLHYFIDPFYAVGTQYIYIDWIAIRKFLATEPAWGAWGSEEYKSRLPFRRRNRFLGYNFNQRDRFLGLK